MRLLYGGDNYAVIYGKLGGTIQDVMGLASYCHIPPLVLQS